MAGSVGEYAGRPAAGRASGGPARLSSSGPEVAARIALAADAWARHAAASSGFAEADVGPDERAGAGARRHD